MRFDVYTELIKEDQRRQDCETLLIDADYSFCIFKDCDSKYEKLREYLRGIKKPCKKGTFTDCQRKSPEEMKEFYEKKKRYKKENGKGFKKWGGAKGGQDEGTVKHSSNKRQKKT